MTTSGEITIMAAGSAIADPKSIVRRGGRVVDWANVADSYKDADGVKVLPAFTAVGELLGNGKISPRVVTTNPAVGVLETSYREDTPTYSGPSVLGGGVFYENLMPDATGGPPKTLPSAIKTELRAAGGAYTFIQYSNDAS